MLELLSTQSMRVSLTFIRDGRGGLDSRRQNMLNRVPNSGDWASFDLDHLEMNDLAYLTAKTNHEFAILRGKNEDILFHGDSRHCSFDEELSKRLLNKQLHLYGHSHPGEEEPKPSQQDRNVLIEIGQSSSKLISGRTGMETTYTADLFDLF